MKENNGSAIRRDGRVLANPHRIETDEWMTTDEAAAFLRARGHHFSVAGLAMRRMYGRAPAFIKIGHGVAYRKIDLLEFLKTLGIRVDADPPKPEEQERRRAR